MGFNSGFKGLIRNELDKSSSVINTVVSQQVSEQTAEYYGIPRIVSFSTKIPNGCLPNAS